MDKIKLNGETKDRYGYMAEITLTPGGLKEQLKPDLSNLMKGDRVWVEGIVHEVIGNDIKLMTKFYHYMTDVEGKNIVAHFPSEPEKKEAELPEKLDPGNAYLENTVITILNKLIDVVRDMKEEYGKRRRSGMR